MGSLGGIGIDWRLVLSQVINFGLLAWILARFLYKPMIKRIEAYEKELADAKDREKQLDARKEALDAEQKKVLADAQTRAHEIVGEAEQVADKVAAKARKEAEHRVTDRLAHLDEIIDSQKEPMRERYARDLKSALRERLPVTLGAGGVLDASALDVLQGALREGFVKEIDEVESELFSRHQGNVVVHCGREPAAKDAKAVTAAVHRRAGKKTDIAFERDPSLVAGFRAEIAGVVVERNIVSILSTEIDAA